MRSKEIPAWCFLTGQFLVKFQNNKPSFPYSLIHQDFLNHIETEPRLDDFHYVNPGSMIMLCYGLLVYPVEFWKLFFKQEECIKDFNRVMISIAEHKRLSIDSFVSFFQIKKSIGSEKDFLRKLRNAIAHSHVEVDDDNILHTFEFTFWNVNRKNDRDFEVSISLEKLGMFLTGLGRFFGNRLLSTKVNGSA